MDASNTYNYKNPLSQKASTTGNYSGIYDLSGCAWEYVMGVMLNQNLAPLSGRNASLNSEFKGGYSEGGINTTGKDWPLSKYYDTYIYRVSVINFTEYIYGDATGELGPFASRTYGTQTRQISSWYDDEAWFVFASGTWFHRGGRNANGTGAGLLSFNISTGYIDINYSFRVVLAL